MNKTLIEYQLEVPFEMRLSKRTGFCKETWRRMYCTLLESAFIWKKKAFHVSVTDSKGLKTLWVFDSNKKKHPASNVVVMAFTSDQKGNHICLGGYCNVSIIHRTARC